MATKRNSMIVAFGATGEDYLVCDGKMWTAKATQGSKLETVFQNLGSRHAVLKTFSFGEGGSWYGAYEYPSSKTGKMEQRHTGACIRENYPELDDWLKELGTGWQAKDIWVSLGPKGSYWAWHKTSGISHHGIPGKLISELHRSDYTLPRVTLGNDGSYVWWDESGAYGFEVQEALSIWMKSNLVDKISGNAVHIASASLSPFHQQSHFVLLDDTRAKYVAPGRSMIRDLDNIVHIYTISAPLNPITGVKVDVLKRCETPPF